MPRLPNEEAAVGRCCPNLTGTRQNISRSGIVLIRGIRDGGIVAMISSRLPIILAVSLAAGGLAEAQTQSVVAPISPVTATLTIPDTTLLPGVPFDMWIEVTNGSDASVGVGLCADMFVKNERGDTFTVSPPESPGSETHRPAYPVMLTEFDRSGGERPASYVVLRPHEHQTLTLPVLPGLSGPVYTGDVRLSAPGRYSVSLKLDYCWPGMVVKQKSLLPATFLGPVTTNEVKIERITPTGSDAEVWRRMQELAKGQWSSTEWTLTPAANTIRNEIRAKYTDSNYYPYAVVADGGPQRALLDALNRFPRSPVTDLLHITAAHALGDGTVMAAQMAIVKQSNRPTTRALAFGREDVKRPCPAEYDCEP